jgi:hypothetical protein
MWTSKPKQKYTRPSVSYETRKCSLCKEPIASGVPHYVVEGEDEETRYYHKECLL